VYRATGSTTFELCATFTTLGNANWGKGESMPVRAYGSLDGDWAHDIGEECYARTIDPERYPPFSKPTI
jgi:hypothetical protein